MIDECPQGPEIPSASAGRLRAPDVDGIEAKTDHAARLIDKNAVAKILGCSWRHVYRLADEGKIPAGCKLGGLRRWDIREIEAFVDGGCKPPAKKGRR